VPAPPEAAVPEPVPPADEALAAAAPQATPPAERAGDASPGAPAEAVPEPDLEISEEPPAPPPPAAAAPPSPAEALPLSTPPAVAPAPAAAAPPPASPPVALAPAPFVRPPPAPAAVPEDAVPEPDVEVAEAPSPPPPRPTAAPLAPPAVVRPPADVAPRPVAPPRPPAAAPPAPPAVAPPRPTAIATPWPAPRGFATGAARAGAPRPTAAAGPAGAAGPGWTLGEARAALASARDRDEVIVSALRYARDFFEYAAMFAVTRDALYGHEALGREEGARDECRRVAAELSDPGFFRIPIETRGPYLGPPPLDPVTAAILSGLRRGTPRTVLLHPIFVRGRAVGVLYADNGDAPVSARRLGDLFLVLGSLGGALERVIRERKLHPPSGLDEETWSVTEPARIAEEPLPFAVDVDLGDYEVATAGEALSSPRALDLPSAIEALARSARGSAERSALVGTVAQRGAEAADMLVARLPGPIEVPAGLAEATPVQEHGPVPAAILALGPEALRPLAAALSDPDPDRRRYAALLLGAIGDAAALPSLAVRVFDEDPRVAGAAREALAAARGRPELRPVAEGLRRELSSGKAARAIQAVRALARLGDAEAIPVLIQLLEAGGEVGAVASYALARITLQRFGSDPSRWLAWWQGRRGTPRSRWLLDALTSPDREVRQAAADELRQAGVPPVPYFADAPAPERERAARAWADWWQGSGRAI
jgi:HEAT repeat protein